MSDGHNFGANSFIDAQSGWRSSCYEIYVITARLSMRTFAFLLGLAVCAGAQTEIRNTVTLSGGLAHSVGTMFGFESAPSVAVTYAYRLLPHVDLEAGIDTALSLGSEARGANYDIKANDRFIWVPFGLRGVLPLRR